MILILQVICDRVIFFTEDLTYKPPASPYTWVLQYNKPLPQGFTLANCWSWKLQDGWLVYDDYIDPTEVGLSTEQVMLKRNKAVILQDLAKRINSAAAKWLPATILEAQLELDEQDLSMLSQLAEIPIDELNERLFARKLLARPELLKLYAAQLRLTMKVEQASTNQELEAVRREIVTL